MSDFNAQIIAEFRENDGVIGGPFEGAPIILMHTIGAKSGKVRLNPVMYKAVGDNLAVFASMAGAPTNPAWYYNIVANPEFDVEVGTETFAVSARVADAEERATIWEDQKSAYPQFAEYEASTDREIPVVILTRS